MTASLAAQQELGSKLGIRYGIAMVIEGPRATKPCRKTRRLRKSKRRSKRSNRAGGRPLSDLASGDRLAPQRVFDQERLGGVEPVAQDRGGPLGRFQVGKVGRVGDRLEAAVRDRRGGPPAVLDRDRAIALAPGDQGRHLAEEVEPVTGADPLAAGVDHRAQGLHERPPRSLLLQRISARATD